jgi:hypothetical protein
MLPTSRSAVIILTNSCRDRRASVCSHDPFRVHGLRACGFAGSGNCVIGMATKGGMQASARSETGAPT